MSNQTADILICGAGMGGVATAYHLAMQGVKNIILVDERHPLSLTSDKSFECYRNWFPGPGDEMMRFMNHSIDLLEDLADETDNFFDMNRRGYAFFTADPKEAQKLQETAQTITNLGAGPLRTSGYIPSEPEGVNRNLDGADLLLNGAEILRHYPFLNENVMAMVHARRCGWLSAQQLGMYLLRKAKDRGMRVIKGRVTAVTPGNPLTITIQTANETITVESGRFVNAAGPNQKEVGQMFGVDLPVKCELHHKISFDDHLGVVPRHVPMMLWENEVVLPWTDEERDALAAEEETQYLLETFPTGVHFRPEGGSDSTTLLAIWTYDLQTFDTPIWPLPRPEPNFTDILVRGLTRMIPGLSVYLERMNKPFVDGGYYCKTQENRLFACPLPMDNTFVVGGLSGYGIMSSMAAGELAATHILGNQLPDYASAFHLDRYNDPDYQNILSQWDPTTGQM